MSTIERVHWTQLAARPDLDVDVNEHVLDGPEVAHDHDFAEIALVRDGVADHVTVYGRRSISRGDALLIRPGAWHTFETCRALAVVNCCFRPRLLERELHWLAGEPRLRFLLWPTAGDGVVHLRLPEQDLIAAEASLAELARVPADEPRPHQVAHLLLLLRGLVAHLAPEQLSTAVRLADAPEAVNTCLALMTGDPARPWTVGELAATVAVSPAHLSRLFRRAVGRAPMEHLAVLRAELAATRLLRTDEPVATVGSAVGWSDPNYFSRRFRCHFGVSPTAFRERNRRQPS